MLLNLTIVPAPAPALPPRLEPLTFCLQTTQKTKKRSVSQDSHERPG